MMGNNEGANIIGAEGKENDKAARFDERLREQRAMKLSYPNERNYVRQDIRTVADKLTKAGHKLMQVAFDLLQTGTDGANDITAIMVELSGDDYKVRYIFDEE